MFIKRMKLICKTQDRGQAKDGLLSGHLSWPKPQAGKAGQPQQECRSRPPAHPVLEKQAVCKAQPRLQGGSLIIGMFWNLIKMQA